ncbi:MAG: hypothetical protein ABL953_07475 [Ilumatobacteraceae bacterium]
MPDLAEPFVPFTNGSTTTERRAGDAPPWSPEPRPDGYVSYAPTRVSVPDRFFFALAIIHAMRCATAAATLFTATRTGDASIVALPLMLTLSHATLVVGCHRQRAWAKLGSIIVDVQASFITIIALIAVSDYELSWSNTVKQVVLPAITIWLAYKAQVDRRRRSVRVL